MHPTWWLAGSGMSRGVLSCPPAYHPQMLSLSALLPPPTADFTLIASAVLQACPLNCALAARLALPAGGSCAAAATAPWGALDEGVRWVRAGGRPGAGAGVAGAGVAGAGKREGGCSGAAKMEASSSHARCQGSRQEALGGRWRHRCSSSLQARVCVSLYVRVCVRPSNMRKAWPSSSSLPYTNLLQWALPPQCRGCPYGCLIPMVMFGCAPALQWFHSPAHTAPAGSPGAPLAVLRTKSALPHRHISKLKALLAPPET